MRLRRSGPGKVKQKGPGSACGTDNVRVCMPAASAATQRAECELSVTNINYQLIYAVIVLACDS